MSGPHGESGASDDDPEGALASGLAADALASTGIAEAEDAAALGGFGVSAALDVALLAEGRSGSRQVARLGTSSATDATTRRACWVRAGMAAYLGQGLRVRQVAAVPIVEPIGAVLRASLGSERPSDALGAGGVLEGGLALAFRL